MLHFGGCFNDVHCEVLDEHSFVGRLLEFHSGLGIFPQQIMNLFIIDLNETALHQMLLLALAVGEGDDLTKGPGDNPFVAFIII